MSFDKDQSFSIVLVYFPRLLYMMSAYYLFLVKLISYVYLFFNFSIFIKKILSQMKIRALNTFLLFFLKTAFLSIKFYLFIYKIEARYV